MVRWTTGISNGIEMIDMSFYPYTWWDLLRPRLEQSSLPKQNRGWYLVSFLRNVWFTDTCFQLKRLLIQVKLVFRLFDGRTNKKYNNYWRFQSGGSWKIDALWESPSLVQESDVGKYYINILAAPSSAGNRWSFGCALDSYTCIDHAQMIVSFKETKLERHGHKWETECR